MANSSTSSAEAMPRQSTNEETQARYAMVAVKSRWEEQGFFLDESLVLEFYTNNARGEDNTTVRGRRVAANSATINEILGLPNDDPSIFALLRRLEDEDYETIKDFLCEPGTECNTTGRNPHSVSRLRLRPEAKLWNTFVKRNLMPTSHNQTVDRTRLVLINVIITGYRFNVGEVIAQEIAAACQNNKGILAFPCIITALCRRAAVQARPGDKYTAEKSGWSRKEYMRKMDVADITPIRVAPPTASTSTAHTPATAPNETGSSAPAEHNQHQQAESPAHRQITPASPVRSAPTPRPSPPPAQSEEAAPIHILQLRSQLQRIEARQLQQIEETKVFRNSLIQFLCPQFPAATTFFSTTPTMAQPAPTQQTPPANQSEGAGNTEQLNLSAEDIFDWHTPMEHQSQLKTADVPGSSKANDDTPAHAEPPTAAEDTLRRRRKAPAKRIIQSDRSSSPDQPEHQPAKRQRRYLIVTTDSDDEGSAGCKGALLGSYHIAEKRKTTPQGIHDPRIFPKPSGLPETGSRRTNKKNQSDPLEVPGNRLSETGSRRTLPPAGGFPARSDQPRQVKEAAVIRSCVDAARTKDPELTQAGNSSTCRSTHLGRRGKYNRECDKISIFFQQTLDQERTKSRPKTICRTNPKPKHTKSTWSISLNREKSCFIKIN
ncbi:hypothetical protein V6N11_058367 [Hibiscus sabdariffa]|uniref:Putative plant transposon protein domain-containing protein n=1 Tax=Hibiscus sabdariffa TaxID=183260 RepID=A0ABR2U4T7_9ROSI